MTDLKKVSLYKIKDGNDFDAYLKGSLTGYDHIEDNALGYEGYIKFGEGGGTKTEANIPWLTFLNSDFNPPRYTFRTYNKFPKAILALKVKNDTSHYHYVATFGQHGDTYLDKDKIVRDFGIKVGMNICDVDNLRNVQTTIHESISQQTERQASTGARLSVFNINNETEFLRMISGFVKQEYKNEIDSFKGRETIALKFSKENPLTWEKLVNLCHRLEERYNSPDYKNTEFKVYDILRHENDPQIVEELDKLLCDKIGARDFSKIHLAPPEFVEHDDMSYCYKEKIADNPVTYDDLRIEDLVAVPRRRLANLKVSTIKSWNIFIYDYEEERTFLSWNAYQCLVAEIEYLGKTYILSNSQWREVSPELKEKIQRYFIENDLSIDIDFLPENINIYDAEKQENREEVYNAHVAQNNTNVYLFDKAKIGIGGDKRYEVCDLLSADGHILHVKRHSSGAASISHLFTQGKFYSDAFSTDENCRQGMIVWIDTNQLTQNAGKDKNSFKVLIPAKNNEVSEQDYKIVFCILHTSDNFQITDLPLMSQYELMNSHRHLSNDRKFKVGIIFKRVRLGVE